MARGLDHIVHPVRDLEAAADLYARLGFTVGARNRHSWGTHNRLVQLPGFFVELLTVAEPEKLGHDGFSMLFGGFAQRFLERHQGFALLMLESRDAVADAAAFRTAHIAASEPLRFERAAKRPDGAPTSVAFSLAFARDAGAPDAGFAVCQQHNPENFWNPAFQLHANTAAAVAGVVLVAENPSDHHVFLSAYAGERELNATSTGITLKTPRGEIQIMGPTAYAQHFGGVAPDVANGARLAALRFAVRDLTMLERVLNDAAVPHATIGTRTIVGPAAAMGATLAFESI